MAVQGIVEIIRRKMSQLSIGPHHETADEKIPDASLAHSTITTMLSLMKRVMTFSKTNLDYITEGRRRELTVLNALATVLARQGEVVAVASKADDSSGDLEVIVATQLVRGEEPRPTTKSGSFCKRVWTIFVNGNPGRDGQRDSLRSMSNLPSIVSPSPPQPQFQNIEWLKESIDRGW